MTNISVEFYIDGVWTDFTNLRPTYNCWCLGILQEGYAVTINSVTEQSDASIVRNTFTLSYMDPDAILDNDNPYSPYYQKISQYMPVRLLADSVVVAIGELSKAVVNFTPPMTISATLTIDLAGITNRLSARLNRPFRAPGERAILASDPVVYWPMNEAKGATQFTSGLDNGLPIKFTSAFTTGLIEGPDGTQGSFPNLLTSDGVSYVGYGSFQMPELSSAGWGMECIVYVPPPIDTAETASASVLQWYVNNAADELSIGVATDSDLPFISMVGDIDNENASVGAYGTEYGWHHVRLLCYQNGADVEVEMYLNGDSSDPLATRTIVGATLGTPTTLFLPSADTTPLVPPNMAEISVGMVAFYNLADATDRYDALILGYAGENAAERLSRLCTEQGITITITGDPEHTAFMGPQQIGSFMDLIKHAVQVDGGILLEVIDALEFEYRTRVSLYTPVPAVNLTLADLSGQLQPRPHDDSNFTNDVLVKRMEGGEGRYIIPDGDFFHWSTEPPPDGANPRQTQPSLNLYEDTQNVQHAAWIAHIKSWKEKTYGVIRSLLQRITDAEKVATLQALRPGDNLTLATANSSRWLPADETRQQVISRTRRLSQFLDEVSFVTSPSDPWEVAIVDTSGSTLAVAIDDDDTSLKVVTTLGPAWSTADEPYYFQIGGEAMKVTAITDDTPAFVAAGTVDTDNNASLTPGIPVGMAAGGLMLLWATIRNSGTGTVGTNPTGWETLVDFANTRLMYRYWVSGDSAPTVSFLNGAANATTMARIFGFSGLSHGLVSGTKATPAGLTQLNASAANIAYPALTMRRAGAALIFAWKQDDWTSVAVPSGFTEMSEDTSATGDDASIYAAYDLTGATAVAGSLVVTGGAAAISRAVVVGLRATQTATVERGVNSVAISHAVGDAIRGWRMGVTGL